ncbi:hypothetical protein BgAZ_103950 [Babesia gibsoni]|uniref:GATA-type domain-containing protein n=1 Tax=Babesia gibsoni TaxID=33632 RepID=A0AAD8PFM3_BABGI|nr:hypothetical protein BgAZ_103950 [Babesia gibsoni]
MHSENKESPNQSGILSADSNGLSNTETSSSRPYVEEVAKIDIDSSTSTVAPPHFASYDYYNGELQPTGGSPVPMVRYDTGQTSIPTLYDESHGTPSIEDQGVTYSPAPEECLTAHVEDMHDKRAITPYQDTLDNANYPFWYTETPVMPSYSPITFSDGKYNAAIPRYTGYAYQQHIPYYPTPTANYNGYAPERKGMFNGGYNMQDAFYPGKAPYPVVPPNRRSPKWTSLPSRNDLSPASYYSMSPDAMSYKSWTSRVPGSRDTSPPTNVAVPLILHDVSRDVVPTHMDQSYEADSFYNELSARLQREIKKKSVMGTAGRPKLNRNNYVCANCNAKSTPQWRYIKGTSVCNACYMRIRKQKMKRLKQETEQDTNPYQGFTGTDHTEGENNDKQEQHEVGDSHAH